MSELQGQTGELRFTVEIKRIETGLIETYDLIGYLDEDKLKEIQNGSHPFHSSP